MISISAENPSGVKFQIESDFLSDAMALVEDLAVRYDCDTIVLNFVHGKEDDE